MQTKDERSPPAEETYQSADKPPQDRIPSRFKPSVTFEPMFVPAEPLKRRKKPPKDVHSNGLTD